MYHRQKGPNKQPQCAQVGSGSGLGGHHHLCSGVAMRFDLALSRSAGPEINFVPANLLKMPIWEVLSFSLFQPAPPRQAADPLWGSAEIKFGPAREIFLTQKH